MPNVMAALPNIVAPSVQRRKVWLTPNTGVPCSNAAKMRNPLKLAGVPKLPDRSQPLVGRVVHPSRQTFSTDFEIVPRCVDDVVIMVTLCNRADHNMFIL